jgi:hypothetical protein
MTGSRFRIEERSGIVAVYDTAHAEYQDTPGCHADYPWTVCSWHGAYDEKAGHWNVDQRWIDKARAACDLLNTLSANNLLYTKSIKRAADTSMRGHRE